ncbi:putative Ig domain-containing protein [Amantichitinum ursilacus]|nr:putative Ig domain-containing protein [Amantichitinum ursilacus]
MTATMHPSNSTLQMDDSDPTQIRFTYAGNGSGTSSTPETGTFYTLDSDGITVNANTVTVNIIGPSVTTASLNSGTAGMAYSQALSASGGTAPYTWSVVSGALPAGVNLSNGGALGGTPTVAGAFTFTVQVNDAASQSATKTYTLNISAPTISVGPTTMPVFNAGAVYNANALGSGGTAPYTFYISGGSIPAGVSMSSSGVFAGTPSAAGSYSFTVTAVDANGFSGSRTYGGTASPPSFTLTPATLPAATVQTAYSQTVTAGGGTAPYTYSIGGGALPPGLTLGLSTGVISGTPTSGGTYNFTVVAIDHTTGPGAPYGVARGYSMTVGAPTITVAPASLSSGSVGVSYSSTFTASGGNAPYSFVLSAGALPAGLSLSSSGVLSGTPTAAGTFNFTVTGFDSSAGAGPYSDSHSYTLTIGVPSITISPVTLPTISVGAAANATLSASGGTASYSFAVTNGVLPAGLTLSSAGVLTGTATAGGTYSFTITATDSSTGAGPFSGSRTYSVTVQSPTIVIAPASLPSPAIGVAYNASISASGGTASYSYAVAAGALPPGLSLNTATGTLAGTATGSGTYTFTISATDSSTGTGAPYGGSRSYSLTVGAPTISLTPATLSNATVAASYSTSLTAAGGIAPYAYAITAGALPSGVTLNTATGALSGTPTAGGVFNLTITATDSSTGSGAPHSGSVAYALTVNAATLALSPAQGALPGATALTAYSQSLSTSGGIAPYTYAITAGALPAGLTLNPATGQISGTATVAGAFNFSVRASDSSTGSGPYGVTHAYSLTVGAPAVAITPATLPVPAAGVTYSQTLSVAGGAAPYTWSIASGALPNGLTLASGTGVVSGIAGAVGTYAFVVQVADTHGFVGTQAYSVNITAQLAVAAAKNVTVASNTPTAIDVASVITGGTASAVTVSSAASHGTTSISGSTITYTPAADYVGSDSFNYTATNAAGTSAPATVSITVNPPLPAPQAGNVTVPANSQNVDIPLTISGGPVTSVTLVTPPRHGTVDFSGVTVSASVLAARAKASTPVTGNTPSVHYTPNAGYVGPDSFSYTASNAAGTSAVATVTLQVSPPAPVLGAVSVSIVAGAPVTLDVGAAASGGPFTALTVVTPPASGSVEVRGTTLVYVSPVDFVGTVNVVYALSNAYGTTQGTASITVTGRLDPSKDKEVLGLLAAQADATRRFASAQMDNFHRRLESLHGKGWGESSFGLTASSFGADPVQSTMQSDAKTDRRDALRKQTPSEADAPAQPSSRATGKPDVEPRPLAFWIDGGIDFGRRDADTNQEHFKFHTDGVSIGADYRINEMWSAGVGFGVGHDSSDIGEQTTHSSSNIGVAAAYGVLRPSENLFVDGVLGYGHMDFDLKRYITDTGSTADGSRGGNQWFASLSAGYEYRSAKLLVSPYGRIDVMHATLDEYTENAPAYSALTYADQSLKSTTATLGVRMQTGVDTRWGQVQPFGRFDYLHHFEGSDSATIRYADLGALSPAYTVYPVMADRNQMNVGVGAKLLLPDDLTMNLEYNSSISNGSGYVSSVRLLVDWRY